MLAIQNKGTQGKTNLSHDSLILAHIPYQWVNNPTLYEFCFVMTRKSRHQRIKKRRRYDTLERVGTRDQMPNKAKKDRTREQDKTKRKHRVRTREQQKTKRKTQTREQTVNEPKETRTREQNKTKRKNIEHEKKQ